MDRYETVCREWARGCSCAPAGSPWECAECTRAFHDRLLSMIAADDAKTGCGARLAKGQWWAFCGETDMGQSLPALCTRCGGDMIPE